MWRYLLGGAGALLLAGAGLMLVRGHAVADLGLPAAGAQVGSSTATLSSTLPEATAATREQRRFNRYDKDRNGAITREEYLASRRKAFARLDTNHDGTLGFDEWADKATAKFAAADADKNGAMNAAEFAATAVKRKAQSKQLCPPADRAAPQSGKDDSDDG